MYLYKAQNKQNQSMVVEIRTFPPTPPPWAMRIEQKGALEN